MRAGLRVPKGPCTCILKFVIFIYLFIFCAEACFEPNNAHTKVGNSGLRTAEQLRPNPLIYHRLQN